MKPKISIIIKALNEESNIVRAIESCLAVTKKLSAEIILSDSLSTDKTVALAKKYPIRIVQLTNPYDRCCGVGPQLGYQHSLGEYIYILDGDMEFEEGFLETALLEFKKDKHLAGVAGQIKEMRAVNMVFKRRKTQKEAEPTFPVRLEMGGLYSRKAIESVGWFSNANLHAYEEAELGFRLTQKGWSFKRLPIPGIKHYGYDTTSFGSFKRRFQTGYVKGSGELLRTALGQSYFLKVAMHVKVYIVLIKWWLAMFVVLFVQVPIITNIFFISTGVVLVLFLLKKRSLKEWAFSLVSWHVSAVGMVWGLFSKMKSPSQKIPSKVIQ